MSAIIYYLVHFWCTVFGETACISYSVIYDILFDGAATSGIGLQRPALTNTDWLHWLIDIFTRESSYYFHRVLAIAILSVCLSVRPLHGWNEIGPRLLLITNRKSYTGFRLPPRSMTLNDLEHQNRLLMDFWRFWAATQSISFTRWRRETIVMRSRYRIWYLYINLAWTPKFSAKLLNRNCYRLSRVSWALAQISC